jgi:hypothetical protein
MVFDGDWNGGFRTFRVALGQSVEDFSIDRVDPETGERVPLIRGDLDRVDHYEWTDPRTVRWRSRRPTDPPFRRTTLVYRLHYRLEGVLRPQGEGVYRLSHDFAFPERNGTIASFTLDLEIDPAFREINRLPRRLERRSLPAGEGVVVTGDLRYTREGRPAAVSTAGRRVAGILGLGGVVALGMLLHFYAGEWAAGRVPWRASRAGIDRAWIERELLPLPAEVVAALWDRRVGPQEVAALIARLVAEGKLASSVEVDADGGKELRLRRLARQDDFRGGYEAKLVSKLFPGSSREATLSDLRARYRATGFHPASLIQPKLEKRVEKEVPEARTERQAPSRLPTFGLLGLALAAAVAAGMLDPRAFYDLFLLLIGPFPILALASLYVARTQRHRVEWLAPTTLLFVLPLAALAAATSDFALRPELVGASPVGLAGLLALVAANLAAWRAATGAARSRETPETTAVRRKLARARRHARHQLRRRRPDLDDSWLPYLVAFGLSRSLDRWGLRFGGETESAPDVRGDWAYASPGRRIFPVRRGGGPGGDGEAFEAWTGGGGEFGGAGATGTWVAAVTGLAHGVVGSHGFGAGGGGATSGGGAGGSGGRGGGGSSGGGGGGGW